MRRPRKARAPRKQSPKTFRSFQATTGQKYKKRTWLWGGLTNGGRWECRLSPIFATRLSTNCTQNVRRFNGAPRKLLPRSPASLARHAALHRHAFLRPSGKSPATAGGSAEFRDSGLPLIAVAGTKIERRAKPEQSGCRVFLHPNEDTPAVKPASQRQHGRERDQGTKPTSRRVRLGDKPL